MADDTIRLQLELLGTAGVADLKAKLEALKAEGPELAAALGRGEIGAKEFDAEMRRVQASVKNLEATLKALRAAEQEAEQEARDLAAALKAEAAAADQAAAATVQVDDAAKKGGKSTKDLGGAFLEVSRGLEDLQYGLGGVINNLPGIVARFGGPAGLAAAVSITAVAVKTLYDNWGTISQLWESKNPFPKTAGDVAGLKKELEQAQKAMEAFEKAGTGTADQLEEYNRLREKTAKLEKEIADQQERQKALKGFLEAPTEAAAGRAKAFEEATKGRGQETIDEIAEAMRRRADTEVAIEEGATRDRIRAYDAGKHTEEEKERFAIEEMTRFKEFERIARGQDFGALATDLSLRLLKGEETAGKAFARLMDSFPTLFKGMQEQLDALDPAKQKAKKDLIEQLNKQGEENEKEALKDLKAQGDEKEQQFKEHLDAMKRIGGIDKVADMLRAEAAAKGLDAAATFAHVQAGLQEAIRGGLGTRGVGAAAMATPAAAAAIGAEARAAADRALGRGEAAAAAGAKEAVKAEDEARQAQRAEFARTGATALAGAAYAAAQQRGAGRDVSFEAATQAALAYLNRQIGVNQRTGQAIFANRGMPEAQKNLIATQIASQGRKAAGQEFAGLQHENMNATGKLATVVDTLGAQFRQLQAQMNQVNQKVDNTARKNRADMRPMGKR